MPTPAPEPGAPRLQQVRALFERALSLPAGERDAFVRSQAAGDAGLAAEVLALLARADADTRGLANAVQQELAAAQHGATPPPRDAADHVQSTATGELMEKLAKAPKLDEQRFTLEGEVGKGGMGAVLRIHDRFLNRRLAMKVLLERPAPRDDDERKLSHQLLGRFLEEAQVTSQLDHPGVVPVHELGLDANGKVWFTMRLVKGRTASEVFADAHAEANDWTTTRALEVILKVCDTMGYAHDKGVLHRDLKPANVMVGRFGEVYVMDWGLAKVLGQADRHDLRIRRDDSTGISRLATARQRDADTDAASSVVSMDGQQLGTPSYMSPEQARSEELDVRADVYSIGAMLYELLTGLAPYVAPGARKPAYRILDDVLYGPPKRIDEVQKGVPAELVAIVERAMAREREQRYGNTLELAADVRAFLAQRTVKAYRTGAIVEMKLWVRRNRALASALAAAVLILVAGIFFVSVYAQRADAQARENAQLAIKESAARQRFEGKVKEFDLLALVVEYEQLLAEEATLVPGWPHQLAAIDAWLQRAQRLLAQRGEIATTVAAMQRRAVTSTEQDAAATAAAGFLAKSLADLGGKLPNLEAVMPSMLQRQQWARHLEARAQTHRDAWAAARAAIAKADGVVASALYAGQNLELRDQDVWGLVPIGMNPESKLWEYYDLRSAWDGTQDPATLAIPAYGADGRLTITGATGIVFVLIPGGTLPPGTPVDAKDGGGKKRLQVRLDPFFLGKYEVTQGQWQRWTGKNPSFSADEKNLALPVEQVSWLDADPGLRRQGLGFPSELQWEYAIRAGTTTTWWAGDDEKDIMAKENIGGGTRLLPVGSKSPNGFGLFDMGGNLLEWCADEGGAYGTERAGDGRRPEPSNGSSYRCLRGSYFDYDPDFARSGSRGGFAPADRYAVLGLRAARTSRL